MFFDQAPFEIKVEWGQRGARAASERGDIVIIVDVLSFSSTIVTAVDYGAEIYPYPPPINESAKAFAQTIGANIVWGRAESLKYGGHSLSPMSFTYADKGQRFVMCSLNGAACTWIASKVPALFIGCPLNASATANQANLLRNELGTNITVVPCGEKWPDALENENKMRPSIEDYLGAGIILSKLTGSKSPDAQLTATGVEQAKKLAEFLSDKDIDSIISSPYERAYRTIKPLSDKIAVDIALDERLTERILSDHNHPDWRDMLRKTYDDLDICYEGGESSNTAMSRAVSVVTDVLNSENQNIVFVSHGNLISLLLKHFDNRIGFKEWESLSNPDVFQLSFSGTDKPSIHRIWAE